MMKSTTEHKTYNVMFLGEKYSGKTTLINKIIYEDGFDQTICYCTTRFTDFKRKNLFFNDHLVQLKLWDTVSGVDNICNNSQFFKYIDIMVICFPLNDKNMPKILFDKWTQIIEENLRDNFIIIIALTKSDISHKYYSQDILNDFMIKNKITHIFEVSSFENKGISELIFFMISKLNEIETRLIQETKISLRHSLSSALSNENFVSSKTKCC